MHISFEYSREKDVWCLLNKGKSSNNSNKPTAIYEELVAVAGEGPNESDTLNFVESYIRNNNFDIGERISAFQTEWGMIECDYHTRAEKVFGVGLPNNIAAYLTINNRCPYNIKENFFFVSLQTDSIRGTVMHELWHFYTWYAFGISSEPQMGKDRYNELKEALTVLLNIECGDLFPEGQMDKGYTQHSELRKSILQMWEKEKNLGKVWLNFLQA